MNFKVGDKVRVRKDLKRLEFYGKECFMPDMEIYKGKKTIVVGAFEGDGHYYDRHYYLADCDDWVFTDEMLESVKV